MALLEVSDLRVSFGQVEILRGVDFYIDAGETLGVVGESGCGKSQTGFSIMGMLQAPGRITGGSIKLDGKELVGLKERAMQRIRGEQIALVMQDPFTSLNPMMRIGAQIAEAFKLHRNLGSKKAWVESVGILEKVGVPAPASAARRYPHQLSGGQRQRVVIAMAFACHPKVLIADEPTTALDVTLQAQILRLLRELQEVSGTAIMLISHDIGAIAAVSRRIAVFYAGRIVETGPSESLLTHPSMPYTRALLNALPRPGQKRLDAIEGQPPSFAHFPTGCSFAPRCRFRVEKCAEEPPLILVGDSHAAACWRSAELNESGQGRQAVSSELA
jgi:oligopeptide/dipeptide ABC transporter ATP-binding protein